MDNTGDVSTGEKSALIKDVFLIKGHNKAQRSEEDTLNAYKEAVSNHPFVDRSHYNAIIDSDAVFKDARGKIVSVFIKHALPEEMISEAADVLRGAPSRTSLRTNVFGGEAPFSGIAGYYDYTGSPVELKCRKTSFTAEHVNNWSNVLKMTNFVSKVYKTVVPNKWSAQNAAIPDVVRIGESPFSTLTINQRFRTAKHTDSGDFDAGLGCLTVLEGAYEGCYIGHPDFGVCYRMKPGDLLLFDTHHYHCNTELEHPYKYNSDWSRLACVFYYRSLLGESHCMNEYRRRLKEALELGLDTNGFEEIASTNNGENFSRPSPVFSGLISPFRVAGSLTRFSTPSCANDLYSLVLLHKFVTATPSNYIDVFGEKGIDCGGLPPRNSSEVQCMYNLMKSASVKPSENGGFSESAITEELVEMKKGLLSLSSLKEALPDELFALYNENRKNWLNFVSIDWKNALERNPLQTNFTWQNTGDVSKSFFELCNVAQDIMVYLIGNDHPSKSEEASFWFCFASSMHDATIVELSMPNTALSMKKFNVKLKDYHFRGTRYFSNMSAEEQQRRLLRTKRIPTVRSSTLNDEDITLNWLANDTFDYQSENKNIDFSKLEFPLSSVAILQRAELAAKHAQHVPSTESKYENCRSTKSSEDITIRLLCIIPDTVQTYEHDIAEIVEGLYNLTVGDERNGLVNTEVNRFVNSNTMQLWALLALQRQPTCNKVSLEEMVYFLKEKRGKSGDESHVAGSASHEVVYRFPITPEHIPMTNDNGDEIIVKNEDEDLKYTDKFARLTVVTMELSKALLCLSKGEIEQYDIIVMNHLISTDPLALTLTASEPYTPLLTDEMALNITRLSSLSINTAIIIIESDLSDSASSLLLPTTDTVQKRTVNGCLALSFAMKEATFNYRDHKQKEKEEEEESDRLESSQENKNNTTNDGVIFSATPSSQVLPAQCRIRAVPRNIMRGADLEKAINDMTPLTVTAICPFKRSLCQSVCYLCVPKEI